MPQKGEERDDISNGRLHKKIKNGSEQTISKLLGEKQKQKNWSNDWLISFFLTNDETSDEIIEFQITATLLSPQTLQNNVFINLTEKQNIFFSSSSEKMKR